MPELHREDARGVTIRRSGREITPVARVTRLVWRGGAVEWHRPLAVEIASEGMGEDGTQTALDVQRIAVHDTTRRAVLGMLLVALAGAVALAAASGWVRQRQQPRD